MTNGVTCNFNQIEHYFSESLSEVTREILEAKKRREEKNEYFPTLSLKYKLKNNEKIDIRDMTPEEKEKVLRLLFSKINENYKVANYKAI